MFKLSSRWLIGLVFAVPLALLTFALAQAQTVPAAVSGPESACQTCHAAVQTAWVNSAHSATSSPTAGTAAMTCHTCHDTVSTAHPEAPIPADRAAELCSECHRDTYTEWQVSEHGQYDLQCVTCHTPHSAQLKAGDINALCATCHGQEATTFAHTTHATEGIDCAACHLPTAQLYGRVQTTNAHLFAPTLAACTACHTAEAHTTETITETLTTTATLSPTLHASSLNSGQPTTVAAAPTPVSPLGYAAFTGLVGLAFGIILAPWLERGFQRFTHNTLKEVRL